MRVCVMRGGGKTAGELYSCGSTRIWARRKMNSGMPRIYLVGVLLLSLGAGNWPG